MGEEEKKPEEAQKAEEKKEALKPAEDGKKEDKKSEEPKAEEQTPPPPPPPPPQEIILKVYMHCEGCARKVRRCLKGFSGVEDVITDCKTSKVVVKGEKADPLKVVERIQKKSHRQVELISPIPKPPEEPKPPEKEEPKTEEKKEEPPVITVVLGVYMHCEACAQEIKKRIQRMKGVQSVEPDLKASQVSVKGTLEPEKLVDFIHKRTGKHAVVVKVEPEKNEEKKEEEKPKEEKEEKKPEEPEKEVKKDDEGGKDKKEGGAEGGAGGGEPPAEAEAEAESGDPKLEVKKNELFYYHPQNFQVYPQMFVQEHYHPYPPPPPPPPQMLVQENYHAYPPPQMFVQENYHAHPPQFFSDENPNACSVM